MRLVVLMLLAACPVKKTVLDQPALTVVEVGADPRRPLRYFPGPAAQIETTSMSIADAAIVNTTLDTIKQRREFPLIRRQLTVGVVAQHGQLELTAHVDKATISADGDPDPKFRAEFETNVAQEPGTTRTTRMTSTGEVTDAVTDRAQPTLVIRELLSLSAPDTVVRLPDQPVGVGASWRITSHPRLQGVQWHGTETVRLTGMTDDDLTLESETELIGPPQDLVVQPKQTTKLKGGKLRVTRKLTVPLRGAARTVYGESILGIDVVVYQHGLKITSSTTVKTVYTEKPVP